MQSTGWDALLHGVCADSCMLWPSHWAIQATCLGNTAPWHWYSWPCTWLKLPTCGPLTEGLSDCGPSTQYQVMATHNLRYAVLSCKIFHHH